MGSPAGKNQEQDIRNSPASPVCDYETQYADECAPLDTTSITAATDPAFEVSAEDDSDSTPRSEVPSSVEAPTGWQPLTPAHATQTTSSDVGYFTPVPMHYKPKGISTSLPASTNPSPTQSASASTTSVNEAANNGKLAVPGFGGRGLGHDRPTVQRDLSSISTASWASTASTATVRPLSPHTELSLSESSESQTEQPSFPNQAYSALESQFYPTRKPPLSQSHILRSKGSNPTPFTHYSASQVLTLKRSQDFDHAIASSTSKTTDNSPLTSPGLFSPTSPTLQSTEDDEGFYASPYLHYTHRQAPKETHIADVDVDPITGRKIVNGYEVIDELGRGVHGKVKLGRSLLTGQHVAIKIVDRYSKRKRLGKNTSHEDKIKKEIAILKKARHPNIVSLLQVIDDPTKKKVYIVLEHVELGEVKWRTKAPREISVVEFRRYQRESQGIYHNDAAYIEDDHIIQEAQRRRERRQRKKARQAGHRSLNDVPFGHWSLDDGAGSDGEDNDQEDILKTAVAPQEQLQHEAIRRISLADQGIESADHGGSSLQPINNADRPASSLSNRSNQQAGTGLEGTMYGSYEPDLPRGRTPSVAGSSTSNSEIEPGLDVPESFEYVPLMTLASARSAFRDTVLGLEYLHYQGVIHRDIKPANLLSTKDHRIKISDFGVSYVGRRSGVPEDGEQSESDAHDYDEAVELAKTVGTPAFYAPELCQTDVEGEVFPVTNSIDVWALGVTLYCLVYGRVPFHDENTFVLMRRIAEQEAHIPRVRLKAVDESAGSRPGSNARFAQPRNSNKRYPHELEYEEVDEDLHDLLRRLLVKDPRKRITLQEVKHHPWVVRDIANPMAWLDETDPSRQQHGKRIDVSKEDIDDAVVPVSIVDRMRSGFRKLGGAVLGIAGIPNKKETSTSRSRQRAKSTIAPGDIPSNASSSSTLSQEGRRPSLRMDESVLYALKASREGEHPLSQSVTASPEVRDHERQDFFASSASAVVEPSQWSDKFEYRPLAEAPRAPSVERAASTAGSTKTIRQADAARPQPPASPLLPRGLPSTPRALESPGGSHLGGMFGGVGRSLSRSMRSRERKTGPGEEQDRSKSIDRLVGGDNDPHAEPSIAFSDTFAAGHVETPTLLHASSSHSLRSNASQGHTPTSPEALRPEHTLHNPPSRQSSISSTSSRQGRSGPHPHDSISSHRHSGSYNIPQPSADERFERAHDELLRKRILEEAQTRSRPTSSIGYRPGSTTSQVDCPPSPDDEIFYRQQQQYTFDQPYPSHLSSLEASPTSKMAFEPHNPLTASSSEEQFTSGISQSTSEPSIPSVMSANSSIVPDDGPGSGFPTEKDTTPTQTADESTIPQVLLQNNYEAGGYPVEAVESADDEAESDDEDDDDFIVMSRTKSNTQVPKGDGGQTSASRMFQHRSRRSTGGGSARSGRTGSSGTMKKVKPDHPA